VKKILAVTLAVVFVLAFAAPVFAQANMTHNAVYKMDGSIDLEKQVGHLCNTGAEMKQTIKGEGVMDKVMDVAMQRWKVTVSDQNDWVTAEDAVRNLTVTSVIELCAPPKYEFTATEYAYGLDGWGTAVVDDGVLSPAFGYHGLNWSDTYHWGHRHGGSGSVTAMLADWIGLTEAQLLANFSAAEIEELREAYAAAVGYEFWELDPVSRQIWAAQVEADPGFSGNLHQGFEAAYGPYEGWMGDGPAYAFMGDSEEDAVHRDAFGFRVGAGNYVTVVRGDDYVGNYFNIDQMARTSMGTVRRFIDVSSPWSHAYLYEDMEVVGMAEIEESFAMNNIGPGEEAVPEWWELF